MENRKQTLMLLFGFLFFVVGMLSLILSLVGVQLVILKPIESLGFFYASLIKLTMIVGGLITAFLANSNNKIL